MVLIRKKAREAGRAAEDLAGDAREAIGRAADQIADTYAAAREAGEQIDPFVRRQPYLSLFIAMLAGLVIGGLFLPTGAKVVYVKPSA